MAELLQRKRMYVVFLEKKRAQTFIQRQEDDMLETGDIQEGYSQREAGAAAAAAHMVVSTIEDTRSDEEVEEDLRRRTVYGQQLKKLKRVLPGVGRGMSAANLAASRQRVPVRYPAAQGGIYSSCNSAQIRYKTGMEKHEFDSFYANTFRDAEGNALRRPWVFLEARNHRGDYNMADNKHRRTIRGSMNDKDRVLCWLEMLRRDVGFEDMAQKYGRSAGTWSNEFRDMTIAAQDMPCLQEEITWPDAAERAAHADFLQTYAHPEMPRIAYIADGTMVGMRNPSKVGKGKEEPHDAVHEENYSGNKGLGTSHIVYCNVRGKIIRVETVRGSMSDRGAHTSSRVFLEPEQFLSPGEVGMGDGNYQGTARSDSNDLMMCVPYKSPSVGSLSIDARRFNTEQRRFRVVVENTIGQIKKWKTVGNGKAFRHLRTFESKVFNVCARLTARIMRVRDQYPRSKEWIGDTAELWESRLGIHYYLDENSPTSYFIHNLEEDYLYDNVNDGQAGSLQERWEEIWGYTGV